MFDKTKKAEAKEETHPATKAAIAARVIVPPADLTGLVRSLVTTGHHAPTCHAKADSLASCSCGWGAAAAEAEELLGIRAEKEAKAAAEHEATNAADRALHAAVRG